MTTMIRRSRALVVLSNVFLHLHPVRIHKSGIRVKFTWCMGGLTFFFFLVLTFTGLASRRPDLTFHSPRAGPFGRAP